MWAFATSAQGLHLKEKRFWRLTLVEYDALHRQWERANGIKPALTAEEKRNADNNAKYIRDQFLRAHAKVAAKKQAKAAERAAKMTAKLAEKAAAAPPGGKRGRRQQQFQS